MPDTKRVIALGFFDGVHLGHAALMEMTRRRAAERHVTPAVLTFDTHPDTLVKGVEVPLINSPEGRAEIIRRVYGIRRLQLAANYFRKQVAAQTSLRYLPEINFRVDKSFEEVDKIEKLLLDPHVARDLKK